MRKLAVAFQSSRGDYLSLSIFRISQTGLASAVAPWDADSLDQHLRFAFPESGIDHRPGPSLHWIFSSIYDPARMVYG
jgi:hypothetical protein